MILFLWYIGPGSPVKHSFPQWSCPLSFFGGILVNFDGRQHLSFVTVHLSCGLVTIIVTMVK